MNAASLQSPAAPPPSRRPPAKSGAGKALLAIAGVIVLLFILAGNPSINYHLAFWQDNLARYEDTIRRFPSHPRAAEAKSRLEVLKEDAVWRDAESAPALRKFRTYLQSYPNGRHVEAARASATRIADEMWSYTKRPLEAAEVKKFMAAYPEATWSSAENTLWSELRDGGDIDRVRGYVKEFSNEKHAQDARNLVVKLAHERLASVPSPFDSTAVTKFMAAYPEATRAAVEDAMWNDVKKSGDMGRVRGFLATFPNEAHAKDAAELGNTLADSAWQALANSRSEVQLRAFMEDYRVSPRVTDAQNRISWLYSDPDWIKREATLEGCQRYLQAHPDAPAPLRSLIEKKIIDLEVARIAKAEHSMVPRAQALDFNSGSSQTEMRIENRTPYVLTVMYSGLDSQRIVLQAGAKGVVRLRPGSYEVAGSVSAANVRSFYGAEELRASAYGVQFFIQSQPGLFNPPPPRFNF
jgi:hypothetical protein